jgi:FkbM family methyltransferase
MGIGREFILGRYWEETNLIGVSKYIDPNKNILEIGGHSGTSSIFYSHCINTDSKIYVYEPQRNMYNLLCKNIIQNNLQNKIIPNNLGVFCYNGLSRMNSIDIDGSIGANVLKRYNEESSEPCNFGGISLGSDGEIINVVTIDTMDIENIGYIHCDAQGSENFLFSKGINIITKYRPVILYENMDFCGRALYNNVCNSNPQYLQESLFDIKDYCMNTLKYSKYIDRFCGGDDTLLIP